MSFLPIPAAADWTPEARTEAEAFAAESGEELSPLHRVLLADATVFASFRGWDRVREQIVPFLGERAVDLYCHALASAAGAPYLVARFRSVVVANGDDPDAPHVTDAERLLIEWAQAMGRDARAVPPELSERVEQTFQPRLRLLLTAFAGLTTGLALVTLVGQVPTEAQLRHGGEASSAG